MHSPLRALEELAHKPQYGDLGGTTAAPRRYAKFLIFVTGEGRRQSAAPNQANDHGEIIVSGIADGAAYDAEGRIVVVDWNSDVDIDAERLNSYRGQLGAYRRRAAAPHAWAVLMTMRS